MCVCVCFCLIVAALLFFLSILEEKKHSIDKKNVFSVCVLRNVLNWVVIVATRRARRYQFAAHVYVRESRLWFIGQAEWQPCTCSLGLS